MKTQFDSELESRLTRYCAIDSQSDASSATSPSTAIQFNMQNQLVSELTEIGAENVTLTDYGAVLATIPGNTDAPTMGLLAHVDTAPGFHAEDVKPVVHRAYDGGPIRFADNPDLILSPNDFPYLAGKQGHDIITASGTTLLGADDKAGVAIIMTAMRHLLDNPSIPHGPIRVAFTPDEEIGRGVHERLPADLAADFAFTFDGGAIGEIEYESFSADGAKVHIDGVSIHPGTAKGKLVNALHLAAKIIQTLPHTTQTPETTDGRDGFIMITDMQGTAAQATLTFILRDFERVGLAAKGDLLRRVCATVQATEPRARIRCDITPQYRNMRYWLEEDMTPVDLARAAARAVGVEPLSQPIRGGTDGSRLTELGIPCPNIFTGMQNLHGPLEWISVQDMGLATQACVKLAALAADG
ncbi:peptidase T [Alisedimentitalea sp. MJ-SS2]|uniref:peptidase T n=1 Tax=Aliisedimentitalea sp. MJ-SS2 TaxID=3049795 RepID=UPI00290B5A7B|nr:peptidase T [Alisedimentitalea sp. MJ-SS2]MDU8926676.1 peptidase T [Alisedimentitalea sp. MJ-SS2]